MINLAMQMIDRIVWLKTSIIKSDLRNYSYAIFAVKEKITVTGTNNKDGKIGF